LRGRGAFYSGDTVANALAAKYRERARELREVAAKTNNEDHRKMLLESADKYEKMAEDECKS